jgi:hypothetical protein
MRPPNAFCEPALGYEETLRAIEMAEELVDSGLPYECALFGNGGRGLNGYMPTHWETSA